MTTKSATRKARHAAMDAVAAIEHRIDTLCQENLRAHPELGFEEAYALIDAQVAPLVRDLAAAEARAKAIWIETSAED